MFRQLALIIALVFAATAVSAADLNVAFVNGQKIFEKYRGEIDGRLVKEFTARKDKIVALQNDLKGNVEKLDRDGPTMSKDEMGKLKGQVERQQREFQRLSQAYHEDFNMRGNQELQKLSDKMKSIVDKYAKANNIDVVLQRGAAVFVDKKLDITDKVLSQLDS